MAQLKNTTVNDTGFLQLPAGTTAQRPAPANGQMRFNSTTGNAEFYNSSVGAWLSVQSRGVLATGGNAVYDIDSEGTTYRVHVFTSTGNSTFTVQRGSEVEYLIVAGGGGGSGNIYDDGGGGGAGGLITGKMVVTPQAYTITVGSGGSAGEPGGTGGNSSAFGLTALGGGGGGSHRSAGQPGGSGGGGLGYYGNDGRSYAGGAATQPGSPSGGFGNPGGGYTTGELGATFLYPQSSGGGGAGAPGGRPLASNGTGGPGGEGGVGLSLPISGILSFYSGGGGGVRRGRGGLGGGAAASFGRGAAAAPLATPNTGGGGGGGRLSGDPGAPSSGASGIVIIRYPLLSGDEIVAPAFSTKQLELDLDFAKPTTDRILSNALAYRWFATDGTNPTSQAGFDALFNVTPAGSGIDNGRTINWGTVEVRPGYISSPINFAWEVSGLLYTPITGTYTFSTRSDDGNQLTIDDQIVTAFYGGRGVPAEPGDTGTIALSAGVHRFRYRMQQGGGGAGAIVSWLLPGSSTYTVIPSTSFSVPQIQDSRQNGIYGSFFGYPSTNDVRTHRYSIRFNGASSFIQGEIDPSIFTSGVSIGAWVNRFSVTQWAGIFSNSVNTNSTALLTFIDNTNRIGINNAGVSGTNISVDLGADHLNKWIYCVLTIAGTASGSAVNVYAYKDGNLLSSSGNLSWTLTTSSQFYVGRHYTNGAQILNGDIANVSVYSRVLSQQEVQDNFNATRWRFGV